MKLEKANDTARTYSCACYPTALTNFSQFVRLKVAILAKNFFFFFLVYSNENGVNIN